MSNEKSIAMQEEQSSEGVATVIHHHALMNHNSQLRNLVGQDVIVTPGENSSPAFVSVKHKKKPNIFSPLSIKFLTTMCKKTSERFGIRFVGEETLP